MSIIHKFEGTVDAPYPERPDHVCGFVWSNTKGIALVYIPLTCFPADQRNKIQDGDKIEGRACPRSIKVKVVGHRAVDHVAIDASQAA